MKILIVPDSFKGTFRAPEMAKMIQEAIPDKHSHEITLLPLADGGEGTADILAEYYNAKPIDIEVIGPYQESLKTQYFITEDMAIMDMASASGIELVDSENLRPEIATTYGTGQMILDAIEKHQVKKILLGLGGSATIDGGAGALMALGASLLDERNQSIPLGNSGLKYLKKVNLKPAKNKLKNTELVLLSDVKNPLLGKYGAVKMYGKQKGIKAKNEAEFETNLIIFSSLIEDVNGNKLKEKHGTGAAGGLGFGLKTIGGTIEKGIEFIEKLLNIEDKIRENELIITGEGMVNKTSFQGKVVGYIYEKSIANHKKTLIISGAKIEDTHKIKSSDLCSIVNLFNDNLSTDNLVRQTKNKLINKLIKVL